jgi:streptogramin lyase
VRVPDPSFSRFILVVGLAGFIAGEAGCSSMGGVVPGSIGIPARAHVPARFAPDRVKIEEFADLPRQSSGVYSPSGITSGPERSLWVTDVIDQDYGENAVVQIARSGKRLNTYYYQGLSTEGSSLAAIVEGSDGALWMTDYYNGQILRMTTDGTFTGYKLANSPIGITAGPDKALWFTEYAAVGRITTKGRVSTYGAGGFVEDIAAGPDGALWFTELTGNAIGRITTHGKITLYTKGISSGSGPYSIAAGPDGAMWFTESTGGRIGRITPNGKVTEYSRGITSTEEPSGIAAGSDGAMWFTEFEVYDSYEIRDSMVGRITMSGKISEYSKGVSGGSEPTAIVKGPDGNMWFVETRADEVGRVAL